MKMCKWYKKLFILRLLGIANLVVAFMIPGFNGRDSINMNLFNYIIGGFIIAMTLFIEDHRMFCTICNPPKDEMERVIQIVTKKMFMDAM